MQQLNLTFEPGLAQRHRDLRECFAACVYKLRPDIWPEPGEGEHVA